MAGLTQMYEKSFLQPARTSQDILLSVTINSPANNINRQ